MHVVGSYEATKGERWSSILVAVRLKSQEKKKNNLACAILVWFLSCKLDEAGISVENISCNKTYHAITACAWLVWVASGTLRIVAA